MKFIIVNDEKHGRKNLTRILREYYLKLELLGEAAILEASHIKFTV